MSATNRGAVRRPDDFYETPSWCVERLLERLELPGGEWLEPASGGRAIVNAVNHVRDDVSWTTTDLREGLDFLQTEKWWTRFAVAITNPPYSLAMEFVEHALPIADYVVMLLRLNFLGSEKRGVFMRREAPDVYVLPNRPSFTGGGTDATEYCWMVWTPERGRRAGKIEVLDDTSRSVR